MSNNIGKKIITVSVMGSVFFLMSIFLIILGNYNVAHEEIRYKEIISTEDFTVLEDGVTLESKFDGHTVNSPIRVVIDSHNNLIEVNLKVFIPNSRTAIDDVFITPVDEDIDFLSSTTQEYVIQIKMVSYNVSVDL